MAVRLHLKLGALADPDRSPDSPDAILVVEPAVGSVARSKGNLYVLVTSRIPGNRAREAARLTAETIRNEYYYDESAGIRGCLAKSIGLANKRLGHQRDRYGLAHQPDGAGPIGIAVAVVRGHELYVATVGPAEAFLIRQARLSTLPDPHRDRGLPVAELEPDVWRGELQVGDSLCLMSANVVARVGTDELKDALVTLHPQSAIEHIRDRFLAADGSGSDGAIAFEATEVASTARARSLVPVRPDEPLAGAPDRSPIPLADPVVGGVAAIGSGAVRAREAASGAAGRAFGRLFDFLPQRSAAYRRVTPLAARRDRQRRAAIALLAFVAVGASLGMGVYVFGGQRNPGPAIRSLDAGQEALTVARENLDRVTAPGVDLITDDPRRALDLLTEAYEQLDVARRAGVPERTIAPLRTEAVAGLDRLHDVVPVRSAPLFTFPAGEVATDLTQLVVGPDGAAYVLDQGTKTVWRINPTTLKATVVARAGQEIRNVTVAEPKLIGVGGPDVLVLDAKNVLWRWRSSNAEGKGTLVRVSVKDASEWGDDVLAFATFIRDAGRGLYNLYVVDVSAQQLLTYTPASDGGGFPGDPTGRLPTAREIGGLTDLYIDGDIYTVEAGDVLRVIPGDSWEAQAPPDTLLRRPPRYVLMHSPTGKGAGELYAFDTVNDRIVAVEKRSGEFVEQYRIAGGERLWADLRDLHVFPPIDPNAPATMWWISADTLHTVILDGVPDRPTPTPSPSGSATPSGAVPSGGASAAPASATP